MLLLAASLSIGLSTIEDPQLNASEQALWRKIEPSVVYLIRDGKPVGAAALIDDRGYFIAHKQIASTSMLGRMSDGRTVDLNLEAVDEPTQLVLLIAKNWTLGPARRVALGTQDEEKGERLFAVLGTGPIRAEFHAGERVGVIGASRRPVTLSEIRFEMPPQSVGGALVFTQSGEFLGALNATLSPQAPETPMESLLKGERDIAKLTQQMARSQLGPAQMTVAYTIGADALKRVIDGFRSPSHEVAHPAIGVNCINAGGKGAYVESVNPGSPAAIAGIRAGDVIVEMAGIPISDQIDYARVLLRQQVGALVPMRIKRDGREAALTVIVGR